MTVAAFLGRGLVRATFGGQDKAVADAKAEIGRTMASVRADAKRMSSTLGTVKMDVVGLREFSRDLRALGPAWTKELRAANKAAAEIVAARTRISFAARPGVAPKVVPSIRAQAQQQSASVKIGGARHPYAMGSNFGSVRYKQFPAPVSPDYSLYRSIQATGDEVVEAYGKAVDDIARRAFPH